MNDPQFRKKANSMTTHKIPFWIRRKCKNCEFNGIHHDNPFLTCMGKGGMYPVIWVGGLIFWQCSGFHMYNEKELTDAARSKD